MRFTPEQVAMLEAPLDPANVKDPPKGKYGEYIEGFHALSEANRIFGFDGWSYVTESITQTNATQDGEKHRIGYMAVVRVEAGGVSRSDVGHGQGFGKSEGDAHDSAVKEAVTDGIKRALRSFGSPLGLALYDKTKANVQAPPPKPITAEQKTELMAHLDALNMPVAEFLEVSKITNLSQLPAEKFVGAKGWITDNAKQKENA